MGSWNDSWMNRMIQLIDNGYRPSHNEADRMRHAIISASAEISRLAKICKSKGFDAFDKDAE